MLTMSSYPAEYVKACRKRVRSDVDAYAASGARPELEPVFFKNLLLALECSFVHRTRAVEGKDGNALKEVRLVADSILLHHGVLTRQSAVKVDPETSVLGIAYGEQIALDRGSFTRLADAFFTELERKFAE